MRDHPDYTTKPALKPPWPLAIPNDLAEFPPTRKQRPAALMKGWRSR